MQKHKAIIFLIIFLAFVGLNACSAAVPVVTELAAASTPIATDLPATEPAAEVLAVIEAPSTKAKPVCAVISADEALHLRQDPDPHGLVLAFMRSGEVVRLLSTANADWWLIQREGVIGYARSRYLNEAPCGGD
jgi:hypothetical protein